MKMVVTKVGRQAIVNAGQTGTNAVTISHIGVGAGKYTPSESQTALTEEIKRLPIIEGGGTGDGAIHVAMQDADAQAYTVYEVGIFLADGTLFAVCSQTEPVVQKTKATELLLALDVTFADVDVKSIQFGAVSFGNAAATTANAGVVQLATDDEAKAGTDSQKALTPAAMTAVTATTERRGLIALITTVEAVEGTDDQKAVTSVALKAAVDARAASLAEALRGVSADKFITPSVLRQVTATNGRLGLVELATEEEAVRGIDETHVLTPATAAALFARLINDWAAGKGGE